jgi:hypothetical protein
MSRKGISESQVPLGLESFASDAALAYSYWRARGCPDGSREENWFRAVRELSRPAISAAP